jgi:hypothetical protein
MRPQTSKQARNEQEEAEGAEKTSKWFSLLLCSLCCLLFKNFVLFVPFVAKKKLATNGTKTHEHSVKLKNHKARPFHLNLPAKRLFGNLLFYHRTLVGAASLAGASG